MSHTQTVLFRIVRKMRRNGVNVPMLKGTGNRLDRVTWFRKLVFGNFQYGLLFCEDVLHANCDQNCSKRCYAQKDRKLIGYSCVCDSRSLNSIFSIRLDFYCITVSFEDVVYEVVYRIVRKIHLKVVNGCEYDSGTLYSVFINKTGFCCTVS